MSLPVDDPAAIAAARETMVHKLEAQKGARLQARDDQVRALPLVQALLLLLLGHGAR